MPSINTPVTGSASRAHARAKTALAVFAFTFTAAFAFLAGGERAHASVVFSQGGTATSSGQPNGFVGVMSTPFVPAANLVTDSIVLYPASGEAIYTANDCGQNSDSGMVVQIWDISSGNWNSGEEYISTTTPPDSNGACRYDDANGTPYTLVAGHTYNIGVYQGSHPDTHDWRGTTSGTAKYGISAYPGGAYSNQGAYGIQDLAFSLCNDRSACNTAPQTGPIDPLGTTGVVRITSPAFQSTTTSPVAISFDYTLATSTYSSENDLLYSQYRLVFTNMETQATKTVFGVLSHDAYGTWSQSDSVSLTGDGTWRIEAALSTDGESGGRSYAPRGYYQFFGLGFLDPSGIPPQYLPPQQSAYASSSCAISFAGTFDLPQCLGYLIVPTTGSSSPLGNIQSLSLANSFPFAYVYQLGAVRTALFNASSTGTTSVSINIPWAGGHVPFTFISASMIEALPYATEIKTLITALLWFLLAEVVYYKVIRSHDTVTPK